MGNVVINFAIESECFSQNPENLEIPDAAPSTTLLKFDIDFSDPKDPFNLLKLLPTASTADATSLRASLVSLLRIFQYFPAFFPMFPNFFAIASPFILSRESVTPLIALIPTAETESNAGCNLLLTVSVSPSIACPTVLYSVAILVNCLFVPVFATASKNSSVDILPSCTSLIICCVDLPIVLATAATPAGVCSTMSLKSSHCTFGFAAIWVACCESVFIACCGSSAAEASPPKPLPVL